jgi:hypothetical protein
VFGILQYGQPIARARTLVSVITIPSQSSVARAYEQFDGSGKRKEQAEKGRSSNRQLQAM